MFDIKIDDIPYPSEADECVYPFEKLKPGQSFFIPGETSPHRIASCLNKKGLNLLFSVRTVIENGILGGRCYRLFTPRKPRGRKSIVAAFKEAQQKTDLP